MKLFVNRGLFVISFLFFGNFIVLAQSDLPADKIFEAVNNSVVVVISYDKDTNENQGSGVVINNMGYIVTNYHVCDDAVKIEVKHLLDRDGTLPFFPKGRAGRGSSPL